jgi:hypothetical protein
MNNKIMRTHFENIILPSIASRQRDFKMSNEEIPPAILFLDGHATRRNKQLWEDAGKMNIDIFIFPAHTSHLIQPLDKTPFSSLKRFICFGLQCNF